MWTKALAVAFAAILIALPPAFLSDTAYAALVSVGLIAVFVAYAVESRAGRFRRRATPGELILTGAAGAALFMAVAQSTERLGRALAVSVIVAAILWGALRQKLKGREGPKVN